MVKSRGRERGESPEGEEGQIQRYGRRESPEGEEGEIQREGREVGWKSSSGEEIGSGSYL